MTLEELKTRCEGQGFNYAYGLFKDEIAPPHLIAITRDSNNFKADNKVYKKDIEIQLDYTYTVKNLEDQSKIEDTILSDVAWDKTDEVYLEDEEVWQVSYFFGI